MSPERALRWLLRLLPFDLRADHAREMVAPHDLSVFTAIPALLALVTALACALPATRAARIDAAVALRDE
ncbi:MAG: hypothetical protein DMF78_00285 [Acidobacteria bacterium]|nr:MAG: hypothetical protein DMF78_00285 [Acidobacteriota bacterium]